MEPKTQSTYLCTASKKLKLSMLHSRTSISSNALRLTENSPSVKKMTRDTLDMAEMRESARLSSRSNQTVIKTGYHTVTMTMPA